MRYECKWPNEETEFQKFSLAAYSEKTPSAQKENGIYRVFQV